MACPSVTTLFVATGYRSFWYSETCIKQLLNFVVSQDRWSEWQGEYTWFCKDWPDECWNLCVFSETIPVLLYRFRCIKSCRGTQKLICWRSGTRGTRVSTDTIVVDSVFSWKLSFINSIWDMFYQSVHYKVMEDNFSYLSWAYLDPGSSW